MTVLRGRLRTNRSEISFEHESNGWAKGANKEKGGKAERGKRRENEGRRGEGAENERRAKLTKWGGQREYI